MKEQDKNLTISNRTIIRIIAIILMTYLLLKLFSKSYYIIELIFLSFIFAIALNPVVGKISRSLRIKSRGIATGIAYIVVIGIISYVLILVTPSLAEQTINYAKNLPTTISDLQNPNTGAGRFVNKYHLNNQVSSIQEYAKSHTTNLHIPVFSTASKIGNVLESIIIVLVLTFMMLAEGPRWLNYYMKISFGKKDWHSRLAKKMNQIVSGYINGQILLAIIGSVFTFITLAIASSILNVQINALALTVIIFFTGLIPLFGHIIGSVTVVVACLFVSWPLALIVAIALIIYLQIENITFQPYIQSKYNEITPLLVFISALIGIAAGGLFGAFIAIPFAGCIKVALEEFLTQRKLI
ncbi:MAG TPA: AI-2E family transporter [Candidatus Dormibacteraeota bacterium]|nr:AI-2E family transporter [Candidatus Dormibacteraeota bacterium]